MATGTSKRSPDLIRHIIDILSSIPAAPSKNSDQIRREMLLLSESIKSLRKVTKHRLSGITTETASVQRILAYLKLFVGKVVTGEELAVVAATEDPKRRVRQLRVEQGYRISTGVTRRDLGVRDYVLESKIPDMKIASRWRKLNEIRKSDLSAQDKWLRLLQSDLGLPVTQKDLHYVAPGKDRRRIRELRTQFGWRVATRATGRPDLPVGVYVLESMEQLPEHDRKIEDKVFDQVLRRDKLKCRKCDWSVVDRHPSEKRQFLEVHHVKFHQYGGGQDVENLLTLCNVDHDEIHRKKIMDEKLLKWLKS